MENYEKNEEKLTFDAKDNEDCFDELFEKGLKQKCSA